MHSTRDHKVIALINSVFYLIGFWHRGDKPTAKEMRIKWFYSLYYLMFVLSLLVGAIINEKEDESIFLAEASIGCAVLGIKLWIFIWNQKEILDLMSRVCVFSIRNDDDYNNFNVKLRGFTKFMVVYVAMLIIAGCSMTILRPLIVREKTLFFEIGFPLDWKNKPVSLTRNGNNEIAFWIATFFIFTGVFASLVAGIFSAIIWYLLFVCSLRYEVLGSDLKRMGRISRETVGKVSKLQMYADFLADLKASIDAHLHLRKLTDEVGSFFSNVFLIQLGSVCICGSIFCLAFDVGDNLFERLIFLAIFFYLIADIFMITYFGNEIKLSSNRLSYCLFESDWIEQPQSTKKCILIFGEYLQQPQEILVGKLYPLTLETFGRILNSSYSMFNILKSFQK